MYDICLYNGNEEIGGFHIENITIEELLKYIKENYKREIITRISIEEMKEL